MMPGVEPDAHLPADGVDVGAGIEGQLEGDLPIHEGVALLREPDFSEAASSEQAKESIGADLLVELKHACPFPQATSPFLPHEVSTMEVALLEQWIWEFIPLIVR